jgi:hypothetical protein
MAGSFEAQPSCRKTVPVIAIDQKTNVAIDTLTAEDFRATWERRAMPINAFTTAPAARRIVFVLDRSGSVIDTPLKSFASDEHPGTLANQSLSEAVSAVPDSDSVALLVFAGKSSQRTEFMSPNSAKARLAEVLAWRPVGDHSRRTPLWDSIDSALKMFGAHQSGDSIIVVSDGGDNSSKLSQSRLSAELVTAGVPVFAILISPQFDQTPEERSMPMDFADFAAATGGTIATIGRQPQGLNPARHYLRGATQLLRLLDHQFDLTVEVPEVGKPEKWHLTLKSGKKQKETTLLFAPYLAPCAAAN